MSSQALLEKIREFLLLWRGRKYEQLAATFCVALIGLLVYVGKEKDIPFLAGWRSLVLAILLFLIAACIGFLIWRMGRLEFPPQTPTPSKLLPSAVRGPLPFVETDGEFFLRLGRKRVLQDLLALVLNEQIPIVVVSGESGAGKTSLLRAGLSYVLKEQYKKACVYWDARPLEPEISLLRAVKPIVGNPEKLISLDNLYDDDFKETHLVVIMDQFEQLDPNKADHKRLFQLIAKAARRPPPHTITWVVAFKRQFGADWYEFQSEQGLSFAHVSVKLFTEEQAEDVMATLGAAAGVTFERELLEAFIHSASTDGLISPVDLAIGTLVLVNLAERTNQEVLRIGDFNFAGGSTGVLAAYLQDRISLYPDVVRQEILKLLLELIDLERDQRIPEGRSLSFLVAKSGLPTSRVANILDELATPQIRLLEKMETDEKADPQYRLPHERLIPAIRLLSGSILAEADRARLVLDTSYRTWVRSRNPKYLLSGADLRLIRQHNTTATGDLAPELTSYLKLSVRRQRTKMIAAAATAVFALILISLSTLRIDWQSDQIANHWPPGEDGSITTEPMPGGNTIFTGLFWGHPYARLWDTRKGTLLQTIHGDEFQLGPDKIHLIVGDPDEKFIYAFNVATKERRNTPFSYNGNATISSSIQFSRSGNVIFHIEESRTTPDSFNATATLSMWSIDSNANLGTITDIQIGGSRSFSLFDDLNRLVARVRSGDRLVPGVWDTQAKRFLGVLSHYNTSEPSYIVDRKRGRAAVLEKINDKQSAVELWDLTDVKLIREIVVDEITKKQTVTHHGSYEGGGLTFLQDGSLLLMGGARTEPSSARLFNTSDLSDNKNIGMPNAPIQIVDTRYLLRSSDSGSAVLWDSATGQTTQLSGVKADDVRGILISSDGASAVVINWQNRVELCVLAPNISSCSLVAAEASSIFRLVDDHGFGVMNKDGAIVVYGYSGVQLAVLHSRNWGWGSVAISFNPTCKQAFVWADDGRVLRYKRQWMLFGDGIRDVDDACK